MAICKTSELIDLTLDWAVSVAEGMNPRFFTEREAYEADVLTQTLKYGDYIVVLRPNDRITPLGKYTGYNDGVCWKDTFQPSTNWSQGGPIIEREHIEIIYYGSMGCKGPWEAQLGLDNNYIDQQSGEAMAGPTPLIAAMRAFVSRRLGDEVDIPEELK